MSGMSGTGHRWSKFWWQDWKTDDALLGCSFAARGFWMALLCIAHEATPCGHVLINGKAPSAKELAIRMGNTSAKEVAKLLAELEEAKVFSRTADGTIYSRRMVKDAAATEAGREWGKAGGNPNLNGKGHSPKNPAGGLTPPINPKPYPTPLTEGVGRPVNLEAEADSELESKTQKESKILILTSEGECVSPPVRETAPSEAAPEAEPLVGEAAAAAQLVAQSLGKSLRRPAYAQGKPARFSREVQADLMSLKRPKAAPLPPEVLAAMPHRQRAMAMAPQLQRAA
jgi:hypothetical protein